MKMKWLRAILLGALLMPMCANAAETGDNLVGVGVGVASAGGYTDTGFNFLFQIQQSQNTAFNFAYHQGDIITLSYKMYTGQYANSSFLEFGMLMETYYGYVLPAVAAGIDTPVGQTSKISLTVGTAFGSGGTAFIGRANLLFKL